MTDIRSNSSIMRHRVVILSIALLFFSLPHTLEDFATGEPGKAGIPAPVLSLVVATLFAVQAVGLYWLGRKQRRGYFVQAGVGLFWPIASGAAQLPTILSGVPYRSGFISVLYVVGILVIGVCLLIYSLIALRSANDHPN
jgi:hypothetical protein